MYLFPCTSVCCETWLPVHFISGFDLHNLDGETINNHRISMAGNEASDQQHKISTRGVSTYICKLGCSLKKKGSTWDLCLDADIFGFPFGKRYSLITLKYLQVQQIRDRLRTEYDPFPEREPKIKIFQDSLRLVIIRPCSTVQFLFFRRSYGPVRCGFKEPFKTAIWW